MSVDHRLDTVYPGYRLTNHGLTQVILLPGKLTDKPIEMIYAPPLTRAQQTATSLAESFELEVRVLDEAQEISTSVEELSHDWQAYATKLHTWPFESMDSCLRGSETAQQFMSRLALAISRMESAGHGCAAAVNHGAALRVWTLAQGPGLDPKKAPPLSNTQWMAISGSCRDGWSIEHWGEAVV